jgi:predicted HTH transcriptional regulator
MEDQSIHTFINSSHPLSTEAMEYLLEYNEEDEFVDFKQTYNTKDPKHFLSATEDIVAFANTKGGYLVFGVEDVTYSLIGLDDNVKKQLLDINKIIQKVNSFIEPELTSLNYS